MSWFNKKFGKEKHKVVISKAIAEHNKVKNLEIIVIFSKTHEILDKKMITLPLNISTEEREKLIDKEFEAIPLRKI